MRNSIDAILRAGSRTHIAVAAVIVLALATPAKPALAQEHEDIQRLRLQKQAAGWRCISAENSQAIADWIAEAKRSLEWWKGDKPPPDVPSLYNVNALRSDLAEVRAFRQCETIASAAKPVEFFAGIEGGGGFSNTTFTTDPSFDVSGSGGLIGVNAGVLFNIPGSTVSMGPRIGWIGSNVNGKTERPPASPFFDYEVKTGQAFYEEAFIRFAGFTPGPKPRPQDRVFFNYDYYVTASIGLAQVQNRVIATSGAFQAIDSYTQTGGTASIGIGMPIFITSNGIKIDLTGQYRAIFLPQVDVNVPGKVGNEFWVQGVTFGLDFRY